MSRRQRERAEGDPAEPVRVPDATKRREPAAGRSKAPAREPDDEGSLTAPAASAAPQGGREEPASPADAIVWKGKTLSPFQVRAVEAIRAGHDVLVAAPTGAGKTLVAEYAIEDAVKRGRRTIYTAPIKALSNQKYRDFRAEGIDVGLMTGDVTIHPGAQVLVMTTEILRNSIFENPRSLEPVEYVVFDEVHFMDDVERGSVWEESLIFAPKEVRFVCLSATIPNAEELGAWLSEIRGRATVVIESSKRPVPLHHRFWTARSGPFEADELDRVRKREVESAGRPGKGAKKNRLRDGGRDGGRDPSRAEWNVAPSAVPLLDELQGRDLLPVLVFSFSRKDCERLARANEGRELLTQAEREAMRALQDELLRVFSLDQGFLAGEIMSMARRGIGYHHAGMLPVHKEVVERMFTSGLIKMLFTTETFALGINMPARTVVFQALRKFDGVGFDYLSTRDYMQMAGRAGRQGLDAEGLVFSLLSPRDLVEAPVKRLMTGRAEPVESRFKLSFSSILHLVERLGRARVPEAWEKSFNQFQHRDGTEKQREKNSREQRRVLDAHLKFLEERGYLDGDALTPRGHVAKLINGFELQVTELLFRGTLENLGVEALAVVFVGLVYEERRRQEGGWIPAKMQGTIRTKVQKDVHELVSAAGEHGLASAIKMPDWGLTPATIAWIDGTPFEGLEDLTDATAGDVVRNFRMSIQLMRQARRAIHPDWDVHARMGEAMEALNRDVVDARAQLDLG
ncbi:MAG: DEAD/DEAH box helicase [Planctomycetota bacterium]|nr:DEAD/DEAH box helicase [Planctomycetota bacterium]